MSKEERILFPPVFHNHNWSGWSSFGKSLKEEKFIEVRHFLLQEKKYDMKLVYTDTNTMLHLRCIKLCIWKISPFCLCLLSYVFKTHYRCIWFWKVCLSLKLYSINRLSNLFFFMFYFKLAASSYVNLIFLIPTWLTITTEKLFIIQYSISINIFLICI